MCFPSMRAKHYHAEVCLLMLRAGGLQHTSRIKTKTDPHHTTTKMPFGRWWERIASDFRSVYVTFLSQRTREWLRPTATMQKRRQTTMKMRKTKENMNICDTGLAGTANLRKYPKKSSERPSPASILLQRPTEYELKIFTTFNNPPFLVFSLEQNLKLEKQEKLATNQSSANEMMTLFQAAQRFRSARFGGGGTVRRLDEVDLNFPKCHHGKHHTPPCTVVQTAKNVIA